MVERLSMDVQERYSYQKCRRMKKFNASTQQDFFLAFETKGA